MRWAQSIYTNCKQLCHTGWGAGICMDVCGVGVCERAQALAAWGAHRVCACAVGVRDLVVAPPQPWQTKRGWSLPPPSSAEPSRGAAADSGGFLCGYLAVRGSMS